MAGEAKKRMFFNADRTKLVDEDDPEARFLAATPGDDIPEVVPSAKQAPKAADKAVKATENK
jgi:hypothetical protein